MGNKKLFLSNSSIQVFLQCKRKYKFTYIDKINQGTKTANKHLSFGQSIHAALASFNMITDPAYRTEQNLHNLLRKNWFRVGYQSVEEERGYGLKALEMLTTYYNNPLDQGKKNLIIEEMVKRDMNDRFILCGKLDKVYLRDDDSIEVVDYKTGNLLEHEDEFKVDIQLSIYVLLAEKKLGRYPKTVSYYYLSSNRKITREITEENIEEIIGFIWGVYEEIARETQYPCTPTSYCTSSCDYFELCDSLVDKNEIVINSLKDMEFIEIDTVF